MWKPILAVILGLATLGFWTGTAGAVQPQQAYAMVTLDNPTDATIHYQFSWGGKDWKSYTLNPNSHYNHWYPLNSEDLAPPPYVRFYDDMQRELQTVKTEHLEFYTSYQTGTGSNLGKPYEFVISGRYLNLQAK